MKPQFSTGTQQLPVFNYEEHVAELNDRFGQLVRALGSNRSVGSVRYKYEVDFAYAMNEVVQGPPYLRGKLFEQANSIANGLSNYLKSGNDIQLSVVQST
jgi:hypothetical protein